MKRCVILFIALTCLAFLVPTPLASVGVDNDNLWAVIICGDMLLQEDTRYLYQVLTEHYHFTEVLYLHPNPETWEGFNKSIVRWAIRDWLGERSNGDDLIFIFFFSHGGGVYQYNETFAFLEGGRWELDSDEGDEYAETEIGIGTYDSWKDEWTVEQAGIDFNGNGILENDVYAGVDECIAIDTAYMGPYDRYWDDEVKEDIDTLSYGRLVFFFEGCKVLNQSQHCFSGGFIRDLSGENRIIITSSSETSFSYGYWFDSGNVTYNIVGYFSRPFINALNPENASSIADLNHDGLVSVREAFLYAYENDPLVEGLLINPSLNLTVKEYPKLEDDGDGVPNHADGAFSGETFFASDTLKLCDIDDNGFINIIDVQAVAVTFGTTPEKPKWNPKTDVAKPYRLINVLDVLKVATKFGEEY